MANERGGDKKSDGGRKKRGGKRDVKKHRTKVRGKKGAERWPDERKKNKTGSLLDTRLDAQS